MVPDTCNQYGCLILVTLQWFMYSTYPKGATLYTEKSQTFKNYSFVFHNDWLQNHCCLSLKSIAPNFAVAVSVLQPFCCYIGSGMPNMCIFVKEVVQFYGQCLINGC